MKGTKYGHWEVIGDDIIKVGKKKNSYLFCLCTKCNKTEKMVYAYHLKKGMSTQCRHCARIDSNNSLGWYEGISLSVFNIIKHKAKVREIPFNVTPKQLWNLFKRQNKSCPYSGIELKLKTSPTDKSYTASLDRIDSSKGYSINNLQWIYKPLNHMKGSLSEEIFLELCNKVTNGNKRILTTA